MFVLFVTLKSPKPQHQHHVFDIVKSPWWIGVHWGGLGMFKPMVQEWLNIEQLKKKIKYFLKGKSGNDFGTIEKPLMSGIS